MPSTDCGAALLRAAKTEHARALLLTESAGQDLAFIEDDAIRSSWARCAQLRRMTEPGHFERLPAHEVAEAIDRHTALVHDFRLTAQDFARGLGESGFYPVLTDARAMILAHHCDARALDAARQRALATGTDMSEAAIGTAGMNCALISRRPVQIIGGEHYLLSNAQFHCAAAPVFGGDGEVLAAINLTRFSDGSAVGALEVACQVAAFIELRQLRRQSGRILRITLNAVSGVSDAAVNVGPDGEILGMTQSARALFGLPAAPGRAASLGELFESEPARLFDALRHRHEARLRLASGLQAIVRDEQPPPRRFTVSAARPALAEPVPELGDSAFTRDVMAAGRALDKGLAVLLRGETGTGKEVVARALHGASQKCDGPFVAINCAALPESLIESELFGYADGAFTGGRKGGASGRIEEANGGTLFLDEIGDMPAALQSRLLRVLDGREVRRLGSGHAVPVDFQLVCATHQCLEDMMAARSFRADLFYRVCGYEVQLPPLRRRADKARLFHVLATSVCAHPAGIDAEAMALLLAEPFPGNVREAIAVLRRALLHVSADEAIDAYAARRALRSAVHDGVWIRDESAVVAPAGMPPSPAAPAAAMRFDPAIVPGEAGASPAWQDDGPLPAATLRLQQMEDTAIVEALRRTRGNVVRSAALLGISRSTLQRRIRAQCELARVLGEFRH